jgi:hypothetical protein
MKKLSLALAAFLGLTILSPVTAEAGGCRTRVTYDSCGDMLNWEYRCVAHDCHGCPIYRWVVVSRCAPRHYHGGHGHYGGSYAGHGHGYYGGGVHLHWSR